MIYKIYENSPIFFQNFLCSLYGYFESRKRFNKDFQDYFDFLLKSEHYTKAQIEEYKRGKISESLINAKNSGFYRSLDKISVEQILDNPEVVLKGMPIFTKDDLRASDLSHISSDKKLQTVVTSGTTGKALKIIREAKCFAVQWAVWFRHRYRFGIKKGDLSVNFSGKPLVPTSQTRPPYWRYNAPMKQHLISMQHITVDTIDSIVDFLNSIRPSFYSGYPSIVSEVARLALSKRLVLKQEAKPRVIFTGAEKLLSHQVDSLREWLGNDVVITDQYGLTEGNCNFSQCELGNYHEDFEFAHIEIADPEINLDGSITGRLIGTTFHNEVFPLIRYDTGDIASIASPDFKCPCGRESRVILGVDGRIDDFVLLPNDQRVMRFDYLFKDTYEVVEAQVVQNERNTLDIRAVLVNGGDKQAFETKVEGHFREYISKDMKLRFTYIDEIERSSTGKFKAVVNKLDLS
ncbi:hypothetical protein [Shewanella chilikensis]|uniref:hypothetical protein n=1 Tax=Shewanella chilikensis TaxID=558541 RepID=UPI001F185D9B|nr:hypothetical protein [Shewanella chilikensis]MCE9786735.1 hypothetical protein [Shewanella chilikensis]